MKMLFSVTWLMIFLFLMPFTVANVGAEPTRQFFLEKTDVTEPNTLSIDVYNTTFQNTFFNNAQNRNIVEIRAHLLRGELMVSPSFIGYKRGVKPNLAAFGKVFLDSDTDNTSSFRGGAAYDMKINEEFSLGLNGEGMFDTDSNIGVIGSVGGYFELPKTEGFGAKKLQIGLEVSISLDEDDTDAGVLIGLRWIPIPLATIDFIFFNDAGGNNAPDSSIQTPAGVRANLSF